MSGSAEPNRSHRLRHQVHFLEVHQSVETGFVALVRKRHVLEQ